MWAWKAHNNELLHWEWREHMQRRVLGFVFHRRKVSAFSLGEKKNTHPTTKKTPPLLKMESNTNWSLWLKAPSLKKSLVIHWLLTAGGWGLNKPSQQHVNFGEDAPHFPGCRGLCLQGHLGPPGPPFSCHLRGEQPLPPVGPRRGQCPIEGLRMPSIPTGPLCAAPLLRLLLPFPPSPNLSLFSDGVFPEQSLSLQPPPPALPSRLAGLAGPAEASPLRGWGEALSCAQSEA